MRRREIDPGFFSSDQVIAVSMPARLLFIGLWTLADREGRLRDEPSRIKRQLFPDDPVNAHHLLDELGHAGLLDRYIVDETPCISIPNFADHQHVHPREQASKLPPPPRNRVKANLGESKADQGGVKPGGVYEPSGSTSPSRPSVTPQPPKGAVETARFSAVWNETCVPLPRLRKPPTGAVAERLVHRVMEFFDDDLVLLAAAIQRAARDPHYRDGHYSYETFCRHVERWSEDTPTSTRWNPDVDQRIREATARDRGWTPANVIDMGRVVNA